MSIRFEFSEAPVVNRDKPRFWEFDDTVREIRIGRDAKKCQVAFLEQATTFGREHCRLVYQSGRYALEVDSIHRVFWNGKEVFSGETLESAGRLQLGAEGPTLQVQIVSSSELPPTDLRARGISPLAVARSADERSKNGLLLGIGTALILAVVGVAAFVSIFGLGQQVKKTAEQNASLATQLAKDAANKPIPIVWEKLFQRAKPSIGLVLIRYADGGEEPCATAWAADAQKRKFATNSHVAKLFTRLDSGAKLVVRMAGANSADFEISDVKLHPGYDAFSEMWDNYSPERPNQTGSDFIRAPGPAFDVALLQATENGPFFPPTLPIASDASLNQLAPAQPLGAIGFPMEGLALGGVNVKRPVPISHMAYIAAVTDYFGRPGDSQNPPYLVQHAIPSTGGASGSPILNERGEVVAVHNAGNVIGDVNGVRVEASAMIFFSQRADLVRELLEDQADRLQPQRRVAWAKALREEFVPTAKVLRAEYLSQAKLQLNDSFEANELIRAIISDPIPLHPKPIDAQNEATPPLGRWTFTVPATGRYMAFASTENRNGMVSIHVKKASAGDAQHQTLGLANWSDAADFLAVKDEQITLEVDGNVSEFPIALEVFGVKPADFELMDLVERRIDKWSVNEVVEVKETVLNEKREFTKANGVGRIRWDLNIEVEGTYLCVVVANQFDAIQLEVRKLNAEKGDPLVLESRMGMSNWGSFEVRKGSQVSMELTALAAKECQVRVVRVE